MREKIDIKIMSVSEMKEPVIYCLKHQGVVVYVGQSVNFMLRLGTHLASPDKVFDAVEYYVCRGDLDREEKRLIKRYKPKYNGTHNPDHIPVFKSRVIIDKESKRITLFVDVDVVIELDLICINTRLDNYDIYYEGEKVGEFNRAVVYPRTPFYIKFDGLYYYLGKYSKTSAVLGDSFASTNKIEISALRTTRDAEKVSRISNDCIIR